MHNTINFDQIKATVSQYSTHSLLKSCHTLLRFSDIGGARNYPFWEILILIRWVYLYTKDSINLKKATPKDVEDLVQLILQYHNQKNPFDIREKGLKASLRIIGYQQFRFQVKVDHYIVSRNYTFFKTIGDRYGVNEVLTATAGFSSKELLWITNKLWNYYSSFRAGDESYTGLLTDRQLAYYFSNPAKITSFKKLFVFDPSEAHSMQKMRTESSQLYETRLWVTKPFIRIRGHIFLLHRSVFKDTCRNFLYEFLKSNWSDFPANIGAMMEDYVDLGLKELGIPYQTESDLKRAYLTNRYCDRVVEGSILIECKAIDISPTAGIQRTKGILRNEFDSTITKGYLQLLEIANVLPNQQEFFGIIITYRDTLVGFGEDAWNEFLAEPVEKYLASTKITLEKLPPERLCVVTLDNWDHIIQVVKAGRASLREILQQTIKLHQSGQIMLMDEALSQIYDSAVNDLSYLKDSAAFDN